MDAFHLLFDFRRSKQGGIWHALLSAASSLWDRFSHRVVWSLHPSSCSSTEGQALGSQNVVLVLQFASEGFLLFSASCWRACCLGRNRRISLFGAFLLMCLFSAPWLLLKLMWSEMYFPFFSCALSQIRSWQRLWEDGLSRWLLCFLLLSSD